MVLNSLLWCSVIHLLFSVVVVEANLLYVPGVTQTREAAIDAAAAARNLPKPDPNEELYYVCSQAEDDQQEDVMEHIDDGADVNWVSPKEGITCLFAAVMSGKLQVVETVLAQPSIDISIARPEDGLTPLHAASMYGRTLIMKEFQKRGHLNNVNDTLNGVPLIHHACPGFSVHHKHVITFLVEQGADINQKDADGKTCLDKVRYDNLKVHIESLGGRTSVAAAAGEEL